MAQRRLVVISYHHPPDPAIGGMRWAGLTKYLAPLGWKSWIVTAADASKENGGPVIVSCPRRTTLNDLYRRFRLRNGGAVRQSEAPASGGWSAVAQLRLEAGMLFALPDDARGWVLRAAARARKLVANMQPDAVVSTGPPHSAHLVAWLATRGQRTRWVVDLRDPWAGPVTDAWRASPAARSVLARTLIGKLERLVLRAADGVVCNTRQFAEALRIRYPSLAIEWIPNAVDHELLPPKSALPFPGLSLACVGTVYGGRDVRPVLRALRLFLDRHPEAARTGCTLRIAGHIERRHDEALRRAVAQLGLEDHVEILGVVPRDEALRIVARSRVGIVLAQDQELQVPAKLYELAVMGITTVVLAAPRSASACEADRVGAVAVEPGDIEGLVRVLEDAGNGGPPAQRKAGDYRAVVARVSEVLAPSVPA